MNEEIRQRFLGLASSLVGDVMQRLNVMDSGISSVTPVDVMVGQARTVYTAGGDNQAIHAILPSLLPGDILVVNGQGLLDRALIGSLMAERGQNKGCLGFVIDGVVRDVDELAGLNIPVFARGASPAGPYRNGPGRTDIPIAVGGVVVTPGDWVIGDCDGVSVIPQGEVTIVLQEAEEKFRAEERQRADIRAGLLDGGFAHL